MLNDDVDDFGTRIDPMSHKENSKVVDNDDVTKKKDDKKDKDEAKDDDVEKMDDAAEEKDNDDLTLVRTHAIGSMETRNEHIKTPIPTPTRSYMIDLSLDKTISKELTANVSPTTTTTSKQYYKSKSRRGFTSNKKKILLGSVAGMCKRHDDVCKDKQDDQRRDATTNSSFG
nr:hypothetical protein [Tanacetum cinerariifolium]